MITVSMNKSEMQQEVTALTLQKKIPIGIEMYKKIIDNNYYYVDKTLLIRDLLDQTGDILPVRAVLEKHFL